MQNYLSKQKINRKKNGVVLMLFLVLAGILLGYFFLQKAKRTAEVEIQKQAALEKAKIKENVFVGDTEIVEKKTAEVVSLPAFVPRSENFQMREAIFGNYDPSAGDEVKSTPLKLFDVRSEVLVSEDGKESKLFIAWRTNKLAISQVIYAKNTEPVSLLSEDGLSFSHALIVGKFDFDTRYTYHVKAKDRWGNEVRSEDFNVYSGKKADSVFLLITSEFKKLFNWMGA